MERTFQKKKKKNKAIIGEKMVMSKSWSKDSKQFEGVQRSQGSKSAEKSQSRADTTAYKPRMTARTYFRAERVPMEITCFPKTKASSELMNSG